MSKGHCSGLAGIAVVVATAAGCASNRAAPMTGRGLVELDEAWAKSAATGDEAAATAYLTDDAVMYLPDQPPIYGKPAVAKLLSSRPGRGMSWMPCCAGIEEQGTMAYTLGEGVLSRIGEDGAAQDRKARYVAIWRLDDGRWRCAVKCWTPAP